MCLTPTAVLLLYKTAFKSAKFVSKLQYVVVWGLEPQAGFLELLVLRQETILRAIRLLEDFLRKVEQELLLVVNGAEMEMMNQGGQLTLKEKEELAEVFLVVPKPA